MVGIFTNVLPEGVNWDDSAAMISQEVERLLVKLDKVRVEVRPAKFQWEEDGREQQTTLVVVHAPMCNMAEVKGIGIQLAFDKTDKAGLGLSGSHFHTMASLRKATRTCQVILSSHASFLSKHSTCIIRADTHDLDVCATTDLCKELLLTTYTSAQNIQSKRDPLYAFLKKEHQAKYTNVMTFHYPSREEGFKFIAPTHKMHTLYEALFKLEDVYHHFSYTSFSNSWPSECCTYNATADKPVDRMNFFKSNQQHTNYIRKGANKTRPTSYATAAVPQQQKPAKVSQVRPMPVTNQNQIPYEQFANMCTSVSTLCKQNCEAIEQQKPILAAIHQQLDDQQQ